MDGLASWLLDTLPEVLPRLFLALAILFGCLLLARLLVIVTEVIALARATPESPGPSEDAAHFSGWTSGATVTESSDRVPPVVGQEWCCRSSDCRPTCTCRSWRVHTGTPKPGRDTYTLTCSAHERSQEVSFRKLERMKRR